MRDKEDPKQIMQRRKNALTLLLCLIGFTVLLLLSSLLTRPSTTATPIITSVQIGTPAATSTSFR